MPVSHGHRRSWALRAQIARERLRLGRRAPVMQHDVRARTVERARQGGAYAACGTRDQSSLANERLALFDSHGMRL